MRSLTIVGVAAVLIGLTILGGSWIDAITSPDVRPQALFRATILGVDIGIDAEPARPLRSGAIELWIYDWAIEDARPVLRLPGSPAPALLPARPHVPTARPEHEWKWI